VLGFATRKKLFRPHISSHSNIEFAEEENHILFADVEDGLGTLPMNRSVPAARPRLGRPELSEAQSKFEG
jgi:hypothetical protein